MQGVHGAVFTMAEKWKTSARFSANKAEGETSSVTEHPGTRNTNPAAPHSLVLYGTSKITRSLKKEKRGNVITMLLLGQKDYVHIHMCVTRRCELHPAPGHPWPST